MAAESSDHSPSSRFKKILFGKTKDLFHEDKDDTSVMLKASNLWTRSVAFKVNVFADFIINETDSVIEAVNEGKAERLKRHIEMISATILILKSETTSLEVFIEEDVCKRIKEEEGRFQPSFMSRFLPGNLLQNLIYGDLPQATTINDIFKRTWKFIDITKESLGSFKAQFESITNSCESLSDKYKLEKISNNNRVVQRSVRGMLKSMDQQSYYMKESTKIDFGTVTVAGVKVDHDQWLCSYCIQWNNMPVTTCVNCRETIISRSEGN